MLTGRHDAARRAVDEVLSASSGAGMAWLVAQPTLAEILLADGDREAATELVARIESEFDARGFAWRVVVDRLDRARAAIGA